MTGKTSRKALLASLLALASTLGIPTGNAQEFPSRLVRIVVTTGQGGGMDIVSRLFAQKLSTAWGRQVIVENRPGANGVIGVQAFKALPADGHSLLVINPILGALESLAGPVPYDYKKDFEPVALAFSNNFFLAVKAGGPFGSIAELFKAAKANPGKFNYGLAVVSLGQRLGVEMFKKQLSLDLAYIPYKAQVDAITALRTGQIHLINADLLAVSPLASSGDLKIIAVGARTRSANAPEVPTVEEAGGPPGFVSDSWVGFVTHAGVAPAIVDRLNRAFVAALREPDMKAFYQRNDYASSEMSPAEFRRLMETEADRYNRDIRSIGMKLD